MLVERTLRSPSDGSTQPDTQRPVMISKTSFCSLLLVLITIADWSGLRRNGERGPGKLQHHPAAGRSGAAKRFRPEHPAEGFVDLLPARADERLLEQPDLPVLRQPALQRALRPSADGQVHRLGVADRPHADPRLRGRRLPVSLVASVDGGGRGLSAAQTADATAMATGPPPRCGTTDPRRWRPPSATGFRSCSSG